VLADYERGMGRIDSLAVTTIPRTLAADRRVTYSRAFIDLRRYNRVSRGAQLNLRVVAGGWLSGDPLPLERRLSVDGPATLPGFEFRSLRAGNDVATCTPGAAVPGYPAQCDRVALAQVEYRSSLHFSLWDFGGSDWTGPRFESGGSWVLFADAGRGWFVGNTANPMTYGRGELPPTSTFRTDVGAGLDFGEIGLFVAKPLSTAGEPARVFVRLLHRF